MSTQVRRGPVATVIIVCFIIRHNHAHHASASLDAVLAGWSFVTSRPAGLKEELFREHFIHLQLKPLTDEQQRLVT